MLTRVLRVLGHIMMAYPEQFINFWERVALENPDECTLQWWVIPSGRLEGFIFLTLTDEQMSGTPMKRFLGLVGVPALLFPKQYLEWGTKLAYEDSAQCEWKSWVVPFTRLVGFVYIVVGVRTLREQQQ